MVRRRNLTLLLFCMPAMIVIAVFFVVPVFQLLLNSFYSFSSTTLERKEIVGFANYSSLFSSERFWLILTNTLQYVIIAVFMEFILGLLLALLLSSEYRGYGIIRTAILFPLMMAPLVAGLIWKFMLSDQFGIVNIFLTGLRVIENQHSIMWLSSKEYALVSCIIADVWLTTPFMMLVLLAGLKGLDQSQLEAADLDGANRFQKFFYVMVPGLKPVITVSLLIRTVDAIRSFDVIYAMTQGGPNFSSEIISTYIYRLTIRHGRIGSASAMAVFFIAVTMIFAEVLMKRLWDYNTHNDAG